MSKIKIFGLGGLSESGKNTYVITIDQDIYIFDCGLKYANESLYGIDYIVPDFNFLIKYKNNINKGTATVIITGKGNYSGTVSTSFTILPRDIGKAKVTLSTYSYIYNGNARTPGTTVTLDRYTMSPS